MTSGRASRRTTITGRTRPGQDPTAASMRQLFTLQTVQETLVHYTGVPQSFSGQLISMFRSIHHVSRTEERARPLDLEAQA